MLRLHVSTGKNRFRRGTDSWKHLNLSEVGLKLWQGIGSCTCRRINFSWNISAVTCCLENRLVGLGYICKSHNIKKHYARYDIDQVCKLKGRGVGAHALSPRMIHRSHFSEFFIAGFESLAFFAVMPIQPQPQSPFFLSVGWACFFSPIFSTSFPLDWPCSACEHHH